MNIKHSIDDMTAAINAQCGLMASVKHLHHPGGEVSTTVQVCLKPGAIAPSDDDWRFFKANTDEKRAEILSEIAQFIVEHRNKQEGAA